MRSAAKVRWVAVLVLSALSLGAQQDAATFSIAGAVVNSVSGDPVPYALVQLEGRLSRATLADLNGHFQFDQVTAGRLIVTARKPGFFNDEQLQRRRSNLVTIDANTSPLAIKLTPEAVVSGHIEDEDGNPVERTRVVLVTTVIENGRRRYRREEAALSDADGNYRIPGVRPGSYVLSAGESNRRDPRLQGDSTSGYPLEVFYPGVTDFASAARLRLVAGAVHPRLAGYAFRYCGQPADLRPGDCRRAAAVVLPPRVTGKPIQRNSLSCDGYTPIFRRLMNNGNAMRCWPTLTAGGEPLP
jgi:hypothetical protein